MSETVNQKTASQRLLTAEDLYGLPDDGTIQELLEGCLLSEPLPGARHGRITVNLALRLYEFVRSRRLGMVFSNDTGFILARSPDTVRGPDIAFVSMKRFEEVGDTPRHFPGPPDLAIEILSPSSTAGEIHAKVADFLAAGTPLLWVVDPDSRCVAVYRELLHPRILKRDETLEAEDLLPGFGVRVGELFEI